MDWKEEPATSQQLLRLQEFGFVPTCPLTVTQAARLIRQYSKHPGRPVAPHPPPPFEPAAAVPAAIGSPRPTSRSDAAPQASPPAVAGPPFRPGRLGESARIHVFQLRLLVHAAENALTENPDRPGVRADVQSARSARQRFWMDTCRGEQGTPTTSGYALEFYQHFGVHFFAPTWDEVREILDALDSGMPGWDKDHPELFYETLKLNYPSLLRQK